MRANDRFLAPEHPNLENFCKLDSRNSSPREGVKPLIVYLGSLLKGTVSINSYKDHTLAER